MKKIKEYTLFIEKLGSPDIVIEYIKIIEEKISNLKNGLNKFTFNLFNCNFDININVDINELYSKDYYHGDFNVFDFLNGTYQININVDAKNIILLDYKKILSIIQHELTHIYEILEYKGETTKSSFNKISAINTIKVDQSNIMHDFTHRLYLSLEHELNATVSMIYNYLYRFDNKEYEYLKNELNEYEPYKNVLYLKIFNYIDFINKFDKEELLILTNIINKEFNYKEININELEKYYKKWNVFFKKKSNKCLNKIEKILKFTVLKNEKFEYHCYSSIPLYDDYSYKKYINDNYKELIKELFQKNI